MRKDLEQYLRERLTALDPTLDVSAGSRADTEVVRPILDYFGADIIGTDIRAFVLDTIRRNYPEKGIQPDSVIDDLVAKVCGALLYPLAREIGLLRRRQVPDPRIHTLESAQMLLGSLFVPLTEGGRSSGVARFYYVTPISEIVRPENIIYAPTGMQYTPTTAQSITQAEMQLNYEDSLYYFDVHVTATTPGAAGNIDPSTLRAPSVTRAVRVLNKVKFSGGIDSDTVRSYLAKAAVYPTQLSLSVARGIKAIIAREFEGTATRIEVVGTGDPDMQRDIIRGGNLGPPIVSGVSGSFLPSITPALKSYLFQELEVNLTKFFTVGEQTDDYYLVVHGRLLGNCAQSRIKRIIDAGTLEVEDPIVPLETKSIRWDIRHKIITLSDVPGGILFPNTPDGKVEIKDDEIHVGGMTDVYLHGPIDQGSTVLDVANDETAIGTGIDARVGGDPAWGTGFTTHGWVRLDYPDTLIADGLLATAQVGTDTLEFSALVKNTADLSNVRVRQGALGAFKPTPMWSDILLLNYNGTWIRLQIDALQVDVTTGRYRFKLYPGLPSAPPITFPAQVKIVRNIPDALVCGQSMLVYTNPGTGESSYVRVVDASSGFFQGAFNSADNFQLEVQIWPSTKTPVHWPWTLVDTVDIDLVDPKRLRVIGTDLVTTSASNIVTTTSMIDFATRGVKKNDVLRIKSGPLAGDYILAKDPFGPVNSILELTTTLGATVTAPFEIFAPETPIDRPMLDVDEVALADVSTGGFVSPGAAGAIVPLRDPAGATSSQFSNAGTGIKWQRGDCVIGPHGRRPIPTSSVLFGTGNSMTLTVFSLAWGRYQQSYPYSGMLPSYDLGTLVGRQSLLAALNAPLPVDYWVYMDSNGTILDPTTMPDPVTNPTFDVYLAVNPHDSDETVVVPGIQVQTEGDPGRLFDAVGTGDIYLTSRTVVFNDLNSSLLVNRLAISVWNDLVMVDSGISAGEGQILWALDWKTDHLYATLFPFVRFMPQLNCAARIGSPSVGYGRTFFHLPTLYEVGPLTRYTFGQKTFIPDPRLRATIFPGYGDTTPKMGLYRNTVPTPNTLASPYKSGEMGIFGGLTAGDVIQAGTARIRINFDFSGGATYAPPVDTDYYFVFETGRTVHVALSATNPPSGDPTDPPPYSRDDMIAIFNAALGPDSLGNDIAGKWDTGGAEYLHFDTGDRISRVYGSGFVATPPVPNDATTYGNLSFLARITTPYYVVGPQPSDPTNLIVQPVPTGAAWPNGPETSPENNVRFTVSRWFCQRFPTAKMALQQHKNGLYYVDVDLISAGVGDEFNIEPEQQMEIEGQYLSLGFRVLTTNPVSSFSMAEKPWISFTPWFLDPAAVDKPANQTPIYNTKMRINYGRSGLVQSFQQLADSEDEREHNESVLSRCMRPCKIYMGIDYSGGPLETEITGEVERLLAGLGETLDMDSVLDLLHRLGVSKVVTPVEMAAIDVRQDRSRGFTIGKDTLTLSRLVAFIPGRLMIRRIG
ncbi:MAG: hypothetical protein GYA36_19560 [Veillonellaceae bacterium]|nr:hypothetical protein [Veillonellaceae bacterium]